LLGPQSAHHAVVVQSRCFRKLRFRRIVIVVLNKLLELHTRTMAEYFVKRRPLEEILAFDYAVFRAINKTDDLAEVVGDIWVRFFCCPGVVDEEEGAADYGVEALG